MRLNKKLVDKGINKRWFSRIGYNAKDTDPVRVEVKAVKDALISVLITLGFFVAIITIAVGIWSWATPSKYEINTYSKRCDVVAAGKKHYLTRSNIPDNNNYVCAVSPDWHQVSL